ncbi:MAG: hypothetical protein JG762_1108 [Deferribacteraceae bacterium]|jgi:hypothetical protein|nr:hypothetical protein [Deferribacteraceae bacterium]
MFEGLNNYDFKNITVILIDDIGELIFKVNCSDNYEFMMLVNHTANMMQQLKKNILFGEIKFENFYINFFTICDYKLFYIKDKIFSYDDKKLIYDSMEKIKNIIEE